MMKLILYAIILPLLIFSLSACDNNKPELVNILSKAKLTERERAILSTTADPAYVFDFHTDGSYKILSVWVEKYKTGKLVDDKIGHITTQIKDKGSIIFATLRNYDINNQSMFNISINSEGGSDITSTLNTISKDGKELGSRITGSNQGINNPIGGEMVMASICYSKGEGGMSSLTTDFYNNMDKHIDELKNYDEVYLFKCEFK